MSKLLKLMEYRFATAISSIYRIVEVAHSFASINNNVVQIEAGTEDDEWHGKYHVMTHAVADFSRDVERGEWFANVIRESISYSFLYLEVSSTKSFKPCLRVSIDRSSASILALAVICSRVSK